MAHGRTRTNEEMKLSRKGSEEELNGEHRIVGLWILVLLTSVVCARVCVGVPVCAFKCLCVRVCLECAGSTTCTIVGSQLLFVTYVRVEVSSNDHLNFIARGSGISGQIICTVEPRTHCFHQIHCELGKASND